MAAQQPNIYNIHRNIHIRCSAPQQKISMCVLAHVGVVTNMPRTLLRRRIPYAGKYFAV